MQLFPAGPATLEAVSAGNADVGSSSQFTFAAMLQKGGHFKIISQIYTSGRMQCAVAKADIVTPGDLMKVRCQKLHTCRGKALERV